MAEKKPAGRGERVAISYKMPPNIYEKVNRLVYEEKKFSTVSDCITQALISFVDTRHDRERAEQLFREYLASDAGREFLRDEIRGALVDVLAPPRAATGERNRPDP
jgi:Arc/MetJ-type ribon-helix-helix transcriptional regulator